MPIALKRGACDPVTAPPVGPDTRPAEGAEADAELAELAKALGHPARVQIVQLLVRREACICVDIVDELLPARSASCDPAALGPAAGRAR
jgi:hypothetical protein